MRKWLFLMLLPAVCAQSGWAAPVIIEGQVVNLDAGHGSPTVIINGKPALRLGDVSDCVGVAKGGPKVFINDKPVLKDSDCRSQRLQPPQR